jgi:hypothetical protein
MNFVAIRLPVGSRCPPFPVDRRVASVGARDVDVEVDVEVDCGEGDAPSSPGERRERRIVGLVSAKSQQHDRGRRSTGLGVRGALLREDYNSGWNTYPLGEMQMVPNLEDREMKRYVCQTHVITSLF